MNRLLQVLFVREGFYSNNESSCITIKIKRTYIKKYYNSRLSRWIDRLLPYNFTIDYMPGAKMGLVDYISRNLFAKAKKSFRI